MEDASTDILNRNVVFSVPLIYGNSNVTYVTWVRRINSGMMYVIRLKLKGV